MVFKVNWQFVKNLVKLERGEIKNLPLILILETLTSVILLGIIVALVELSCTGGIYLAILSLMHIPKALVSLICYLLLQSCFFILPLLAIYLINSVYYFF